jgi:excisionase family DNA binding protein
MIDYRKLNKGGLTYMSNKFYTVKELSDLLKVSEIHIRTIIRDKQLEAFKVGREWRVTEESIQAYIEKNKNI